MRPVVPCVGAIMRGRTHPQVLWLSAQGSSLDGDGGEACRGVAGTTRVGTGLRSVTWTADLREQDVLENAEDAVQKRNARTVRMCCIWDDRGVDTVESDTGEG